MAPRVVGNRRTPRDLLLLGRAESISDAGLLSILIGERSGERAEALLAEHPIPDGLWRVCAEDLVALEGVGPAGAARLLACLEMSRRAVGVALRRRGRRSRRPRTSSPCARRSCADWTASTSGALALNTKNQLLKMVEVSVGSLNASIVHPRELFKEAVRVSAASVVRRAQPSQRRPDAVRRRHPADAAARQGGRCARHRGARPRGHRRRRRALEPARPRAHVRPRVAARAQTCGDALDTCGDAC